MLILTDPIDPERTEPPTLVSRYRTAVTEAANREHRSTLRSAPGVDDSAIDTALAGDGDALPLEAAVSILAIDAGIDPDAAQAAVRDHLLLAMSGAIVDVDALAMALEEDDDPGEVHAKIEGRLPMTLGEYAHLHHAIVRQGR